VPDTGKERGALPLKGTATFIFFIKVEGDITALIFFIKKVGGRRYAASLPYIHIFIKKVRDTAKGYPHFYIVY
jgi:hypothetical protein